MYKPKPKQGAESNAYPGKRFLLATISPGLQLLPKAPNSPDSAVGALELGVPLQTSGVDGRSQDTLLSSVSRIPPFLTLKTYRMSAL